MRYRSSLMGLGLMWISGCQHDPEPEKKHPPQLAQHDPAAVELAAAATTVSQALVDLAKVQEAALAQQTKAWKPSKNPRGMARASIDWAGPLEPLVQRIAEINGYRLEIFGRAPTVPIVIAIKSRNMLYERILKQIDYLAGQHAHLKVTQTKNKQKIIELYYAQT